MWEDFIPDMFKDENYNYTTCQEARGWAHGYRPELTFDEDTWNGLLKELAKAGINQVIIDLGDGVIYDSHPEIAVKNAWSTKKLRTELEKMRKMGLEPIPKMNFATTHDIWLGEYSRMVSTKKYYTVCRDLIEEVVDIFDTPRFFHLGMDEEYAVSRWHYVVVRQHDLWWHDLYFLTETVEKLGTRPWVFGDMIRHKEDYLQKMPKSVLQSYWYYKLDFGQELDRTKSGQQAGWYDELDKHGFDQIPTASNHYNDENFEMTVDYCKKALDPSRLLGFCQTPWRPTLQPCFERHLEAMGQVERAIKSYSG
jgi:hypothetical protein